MKTARDFGAFLLLLGQQWVTVIMGGAVFAVLMVSERIFAFTISRWAYGSLAFGLTFLLAAFRVWRDARDRGEALERQLEKVLTEDVGLVIRDLSDDQFWFLSLVQRHGARREFVRDIGGAIAGAIWIGDTPISFSMSDWFFALAQQAEKCGNLVLEQRPGTQPYRIPSDILESLRAEHRRGRKPRAPTGTLFDSRSGAALVIEP